MALTLLLACAGADPAGPTAACVAVVQADGRLYALERQDPALSASSVSETVFAEITSSIGCDDTVTGEGDTFEDVDEDNESNFLPVGTTLHPIEGTQTSRALAVMWEGEWQPVVHR